MTVKTKQNTGNSNSVKGNGFHLVDYKKEKEQVKLGGKTVEDGGRIGEDRMGSGLTKHNVYSCEILK